jgi:predicted DNA-binding transcriptional regulator AlpA
MPDEGLGSSEQAAEYLGVLLHVLYRWRTAGTGPRSYHVGRETKYFKRDIDTWLASRVNQPTTRSAETGGM